MNAFQAQASQFAELLSSPRLNPSELLPMFLRFRGLIEQSLPEWDFVDPQLIPLLLQIEETLNGAGQSPPSVRERRALAQTLFRNLSSRLNDRDTSPLAVESPTPQRKLVEWLAPSALLGLAGALMLAMAHASSGHSSRTEITKHDIPQVEAR